MANVVKLVNGGAIQVRTGVIQGIGPVGPRGLVGPQGIQGEQGPIGQTGPQGAILQQQSRTNVGSTNTLAAATDTVIAFGDIDYDDGSVCFSSSNFLFRDAGDWLFSVFLRFDDTAAGLREVWLQSQTAGLIARCSRQSAAGQAFFVDLTYAYRVKPPAGEYVNVVARSAQAVNVSLGACTVSRMGSGRQGEVGPIGPQGPPGPTGATGGVGPAGAPGGAYASYNALVGH